MRILFFIFILLTLSFGGELLQPLPTKIIYDKNKVKLGRELFFEAALSRDKDISCASCHSVYGADNQKVSLGTQGKKGDINTPSVFNLTYHPAYFWNGRSNTLKEQMLDGPLFNKHEMDSDKDSIMEFLRSSKKYETLFQKAYGSKPSFENMLDAIARFEKTLITPNAKFDRYLRGEIELSKDEMDGYELFEQNGCISCHNGINFGANSYQKFGTVIPYGSDTKSSKDRSDVTGKKSDINVYKVPSLRNAQYTYPYFHNASSSTLKDAIQRMAYHNVGTLLSDDEVNKIELFINSLSGEIPKTFYGDEEN